MSAANAKKMPNSLPQFLWYVIKPQKWQFLVLLCTHFAWAINESVFPLFLKLFIDGVNAHANDKASLLADLGGTFLLFASLWVSIEVCFRVFDFLSAKTFPQFTFNIRKIMFSYTLGHSHTYFSEHFAGTIASKISRMPDAMLNLVSLVMTIFIPVIGAILIEIGILYFANPIFSMFLLIWFIIHMSIAVLALRKTGYYSHEFSESLTLLNGKVVDALTNMVNIRLFSRHPFEKSYINRFQKETRLNYHKMMHYNAWTKTFLGATGLIFIFSMLGGGLYSVSRNLITIGDFALIMSSLTLIGLVWYMSMNLIQFFQDVGTCQQALSLVYQQHQIKDVEHAKPLRVTRGEIKFENVSFNYVANQNLFSQKNITINGGEKIGLVGYSGSGKTTFVNLILRYFDLQDGRILIDGQDIRLVTQRSLRRQVSVIPQDSSLFHRTLMENIRYGRLTATDDEVITAAKAAHCDEFIRKIPLGYQALVGERGIKLSGGQRQRVAIARAFLKNAPILILDEATSSLDSVTEKYIQESLHELMSNRTTIVIAHRLSTLRAMDRILVFDQGKIIADGTHSELLETCSHYAYLWETQSGGMLPSKPNDSSDEDADEHEE